MLGGAASPLSQTLGVGVCGPNSNSGIAKITEFYELRHESDGFCYAGGHPTLASADLLGRARRDGRIALILATTDGTIALRFRSPLHARTLGNVALDVGRWGGARAGECRRLFRFHRRAGGSCGCDLFFGQAGVNSLGRNFLH